MCNKSVLIKTDKTLSVYSLLFQVDGNYTYDEKKTVSPKRKNLTKLK